MRYRVLATAFAACAAVGPLALLAAGFRAAPATGAVTASAGALAALAAPALALAAGIAALLLLVLAFDVVRLRRVKRAAVPFGSVAVRRAQVGVSRTVATPTAIGYLHPAVILPQGFRDRVDDREFEAVLAHECAHLARLDDWAKAVQSAVLRAGWWLPGLWILSRALDLERELASDERAAAESGPRRYAACLLRLATARGTDAVAPGLWGRRSHVAIRVERLLRPSAGGTPVLRAVALGAFTALLFALASAAMLAVPGTAARAVAVSAARHVKAQEFVVARAVQRHLARPAHAHSAAAGARVISFVTSAPPAAPAVHPAAPPQPSVPAPVTIAVAASAPAAPHAAEPAARAPARHPAPFRPQFSAETLVASTAAPQRRCPTCFGPLRSPDVAVPAPPPAPFTAASGGSAAGASAIAAGDPSSGPVDLNSGLVWYRISSRAVQLP